MVLNRYYKITCEHYCLIMLVHIQFETKREMCNNDLYPKVGLLGLLSLLGIE